MSTVIVVRFFFAFLPFFVTIIFSMAYVAVLACFVHSVKQDVLQLFGNLFYTKNILKLQDILLSMANLSM